MARSDRISRLIDKWSHRAQQARYIERQFREWGNYHCAEIAASMSREIERCRDDLRRVNYPLDQPQSADAVDPSAADPGKPSTRV
jgi:hypothetical protein